MTEHERRMEAAHKAMRARHVHLEEAIAAYHAPLPEPQLITEEMLGAALRAWHECQTDQPVRAAVEAGMLESPVIKAAQEWRRIVPEHTAAMNSYVRDLRDAIDEAGL